MGNIYYDPPNGTHVSIPVSLRHHPDRDAFLALLAADAEAGALAFAQRLFGA